MATPSLDKLLAKVATTITQPFIVGIDPGKTTGVCVLDTDTCKVITCTQVATGSIEYARLHLIDYLKDYQAVEAAIVIEDYRVFAWKTQQHTFSDLHTPRLIGALEWECAGRSLPVYKQGPQPVKGFCTDQKIKDWGLWLSGKPHAIDALRHTLYFALFGPSSKHKK